VYILFSYRAVCSDANKSIDYLLRYCCRVFWLVVKFYLCLQIMYVWLIWIDDT